VERGADPTIATHVGMTPLMAASHEGHLEVVRLLLGHHSAKAAINRHSENGQTALWRACCMGRGGVARALLESGADPTLADRNGISPMIIAREAPPPPDPDNPDLSVSPEGRRECVAVLEASP
jgi:uncharacterized protein